jgi:hypothetical protein
MFGEVWMPVLMSLCTPVPTPELLVGPIFPTLPGVP